MSLQDVQLFYERLATDVELRTQIQAVKSKEECSKRVQEAGYDFTQAKRGIRERFYQESVAEGLPFDNGKFALVEESINAPLPDDAMAFSASCIQWPKSWHSKPGELINV